MHHSASALLEILQYAIDALVDGRVRLVKRWDPRSGKKVPWHFDRDIEQLNACCQAGTLYDQEDYVAVILECLEIAFENPLATYKPPMNNICSHKEAQGREMFAFVVRHPDFSIPLYTKFCLIEQSNGTWYISIDCHPSV